MVFSSAFLLALIFVMWLVILLQIYIYYLPRSFKQNCKWRQPHKPKVHFTCNIIVFMLLHLIWRVSVKRCQQWTFASSAWNFKRFSATQHWNRKWLLRIVRDGFWLFRHFSSSFHCTDSTAALQTVAHRQHALSSPDPDFPPCCLECIFHIAISLFKHSNSIKNMQNFVLFKSFP